MGLHIRTASNVNNVLGSRSSLNAKIFFMRPLKTKDRIFRCAVAVLAL